MPSLAGLIDDLVLAPLAGLRAVDAGIARAHRRRLVRDAVFCFRHTPALQAALTLDLAGADAPWVWSQGHTHPAAIALGAVGPMDAEARVRANVDLAECHEEHPAPWHWDVLRFLSGVVLARGDHDLGPITHWCRERYVEIMQRAGTGDARHASVVFVQDLPLAALPLIEQAADPRSQDTHLRTLVTTSGKTARLRRTELVVDDRAAQLHLVPAIEAAWAMNGLSGHATILDCAGAGMAEDGAAGARRWLALIRENAHGHSRLRVLKIDERPPSALARLLSASPFAIGPCITGATTVRLGHDPYQALLPGTSRPYLVRTLGHFAMPLISAGYDADDLRAYARLAATVIAAFHLRGLTAIGESVAEQAAAIAADARRRELVATARALAAAARRAHRLLRGR